MMGDGHLDTYQIEVVTNSITDREHIFHTAKLIEELFGFAPRVHDRKNQNAISAVASSVALGEYIEKLGMPRGNKIKGGLSVPVWIKEDRDFSKAFIRGVFDTDGCVFMDKHVVKGKTYYSLGWTITSNAGTFILSLLEVLKSLGFSPTNTSRQNSVYLRKRIDIEKYFLEVGTNNLKHSKRYKEFCWKRAGEADRASFENW